MIRFWLHELFRWHKWTTWSEVRTIPLLCYYQERECKICHVVERQQVFVQV